MKILEKQMCASEWKNVVWWEWAGTIWADGGWARMKAGRNGGVVSMGGWERKVGVEHCGKAWLGVRKVDECGRVGQVMSEWVTVCARGRYQSKWAGGRHGWVGAQTW